MNNSVSILVEKHRWNEGTAEAHVRSKGRCTYCDEDLLGSRIGYWSMQIDHLLPKSKFYDEEWNFENWVTSCSMCNSMKGAWSPLEDGEDAAMMLSSNKELMVKRVRKYLRECIDYQENEYEAVKAIIRS